jgi:hypothetical protein
MARLRIGYSPISAGLTAPGDRRRVAYWAKSRNHYLTTNLDERLDLIIASVNSDFNAGAFVSTGKPLIFDLVDAYLSPSSNLNDCIRGTAKFVFGDISRPLKPFSHSIGDFCARANAVICSSQEQELLIQKYNSNTHIILDSHHEIPFLAPRESKSIKNGGSEILWEGQAATLNGLKQVKQALEKLKSSENISLNLVTDQKLYRLLGRFLPKNTEALVARELPLLKEAVRIYPWSVDNLVFKAKSSNVAIIPIDLRVPMNNLKPENRLLIMWRLGLPCLTSPSPAYIRVSNGAGVDAICEDENDWLVKIQRLITDANYSENQVRLGQLYLKKYHSENSLLKKWDNVVESVLK